MANEKVDGNATLYCFKTSGKYYTDERFTVPLSVFTGAHCRRACRDIILASNGGKCPGLISDGAEFIWVVIPDEQVDGWPLLLHPNA